MMQHNCTLTEYLQMPVEFLGNCKWSIGYVISTLFELSNLGIEIHFGTIIWKVEHVQLSRLKDASFCCASW